MRDEPHRLARGVRTGALAGLLALLVHSAFDFNLRIPSNALLAALLAALAVPSGGFVALPVLPNGRRFGGWHGMGRVAFALTLAVSLGVALFAPCTSSAFDPAPLRRATATSAAGLRGAALEREIAAHLRRRPADAPAWAALAWLRLPRSPAEAEALAAWSQLLDPQHATLRAASQRIRDAAARTRPAGAAQSQPRTP